MKDKHKLKGFTLIELAIVITVIGILATVTVFSIGNWRKRAAETEVSTTLSSVVAAMRDARNFNNVYPTAVPADAGSNENVTVTYTSGNTVSYCIDGVSIPVPAVKMFVSNIYSTPQKGTCATGVAVPGTWAVGGPSGTSSAITYGCSSSCQAFYDMRLSRSMNNFATGVVADQVYLASCTSATIGCGSVNVTVTATAPVLISRNSTGPWSTSTAFGGSLSAGQSALYDFYVTIPSGDTSPEGTTATVSITAGTAVDSRTQLSTGTTTRTLVLVKN